ncbi:MAG: hypothetical protein B5766_11135 [Candidatus Lumbricidophila eiseniae]|uniref:Uncharacterized protein n=1 Tax=Candidatus Lumbricidiphila eiseniae TaxID=1969409 RepID=A0A2A6FNL1_9MICO|nr:MAG: hypothetical protein B5766_11135 [Candidatus Lumbricidophila eiseniae]
MTVEFCEYSSNGSGVGGAIPEKANDDGTGSDRRASDVQAVVVSTTTTPTTTTTTRPKNGKFT